MSKIHKDTKNGFLKNLTDDLMNSSINRVLIRGYSWKMNFRLVLETLELCEFYNGLLTTQILKKISDLFMIAGFEGVEAHLNEITVIGKIENEFTKLNCHICHGIGKDFNLIFPIQSQLINEKNTQRVIDAIKNSMAKKTIIITTNDFDRNPEKLYSFVDSVQILDVSKNSGEGNEWNFQEKMKILKENFNAKGKDLPY